ncbi:methylated-DNA--[protein]-cysteine S-methyltransferase [Geotalea sp. SG265]|uniref:methylated-DNA--[protein]-cysteine S-methyltransferase n=1 Tax=Geotalea sp. SG265 TaxID=2922867 RepID=UPI001FAF3F80|nr:methylated-DNA--[protein]-cysteine S-methyltransferase [Geotalea sp. SG265]
MNKPEPTRDAAPFYSLYSTPIGAGGVVASAAGLVEVFLPFDRQGEEETLNHLKKLYPEAQCGNELTERAADLLQRYFAGERVDFPLALDMSRFTPFQRRVYEAVCDIPYGCVRTYARVAAELGCKGAARGVGTAMALNPLPIIVPCHRVVGASGAMTGYSAAGGVASKVMLLKMEGLSFDKKGRVIMLD